MTADSFNPRFRAHHPSGHESLIEEMIDEPISARLITKDSKPITFQVPDGCDSVELSYGPIEVNPHTGHASDLDQVVAIAPARVMADLSECHGTCIGPVQPGSNVIVTVPWRAPSFVALGANHLKVTVYARFYKAPVGTFTTK